jgi:hypothetical protein
VKRGEIDLAEQWTTFSSMCPPSCSGPLPFTEALNSFAAMLTLRRDSCNHLHVIMQ